MKPMLQITTTRAQFEMETIRPHLKISDSYKPKQTNTGRASDNMKRQAARVEMSDVRRNSDMGTSGAGRQVVGQGAQDAQSAYAASGNYSAIGSQMVGSSYSMSTAGAQWENNTMQHAKSSLVLVPVSPKETHYMPSSAANAAAQQSSQELRARIGWEPYQSKFDYVPGSIKVNFTQYASINIEYTGGPLYVPASADPNFEAEA